MNDYRQYLREEDLQQLEQVLAGPWTDAWDRVRDLWRRADVVCIGIVGPVFEAHVTLEFAAALEFPRRFTQAAQVLFPALHDPSPTVVAYAFQSLRECPEWQKDKLPDSVFKRREEIQWHSGCFGWRRALGEGLAELTADHPQAEDPWERTKEAERRWAGRERSCPKCRTVFMSVQDLGVCPKCQHRFRASQEGV